MIKRTFVLFFCLVQPLAFALSPDQASSLYKKKFAVKSFQLTTKTDSEVEQGSDFCETLHDVCEDECYENIPIIQAHETDSEWRENLSDLLHHRNSTYRFVNFESLGSVYFQFTTDHKILHKGLHPVSLFKAVSTLPDYYSFLHRLCPF